MPWTRSSIIAWIPPPIALFFLIDIGLCVLYAGNHLAGLPHSKLSSLLDLNGERSVAAWYSSIQFFCIFCLSALFSYRKAIEKTSDIILILLPAIFLLMSIDETVQLHEWLGQQSDVLLAGGSREGTLVDRTGIWMFVIGFPFFVLFLWLVYAFGKHVSHNLPSLFKMVIGMFILLTGALGFELVANFVGNGFSTLVVILEEGLEMAGATVILWAVYDLAIPYIAIAQSQEV